MKNFFLKYFFRFNIYIWIFAHRSAILIINFVLNDRIFLYIIVQYNFTHVHIMKFNLKIILKYDYIKIGFEATDINFIFDL